MRLTLVTPSQADVVSLVEAKEHLRLAPNLTDDDARLTAYIQAAQTYVAGQDGWLGRSLLTATWELRLNGTLDVDELELPRPPIQSVRSFIYIDPDGVQQTLWDEDAGPAVPRDATKYGFDAPSATLFLVSGASWPEARTQPGAVRIRYRAGFGDNPEDVPASIRLGLAQLAAHWYEHREPILVGQALGSVPLHVDALLTPHRLWEF